MEVERGELLELLKPQGVTNAQLLRWVQAGLLPHPRREGLGRGRGGRSYYPRLVILQAESLARLLKQERSLGVAGWRLWLLGYPVTPFVRAMLLADLDAAEVELREELSQINAGKPSRLIQEVKRSNGDPMGQRLGAVLEPKGLQVYARMVIEQRLGILKADQYSELDWANYQDAGVAMLFPELIDHKELPDPGTIPSGVQQVTRDANIDQLRAVLQTTDEKLFVTARNELQWLWEYYRDPTRTEMPFPEPDDFLRFLRFRLEPDGPRQIATWMNALGQTRIPPSPLARMLRAQQAPSTPTI